MFLQKRSAQKITDLYLALFLISVKLAYISCSIVGRSISQIISTAIGVFSFISNVQEPLAASYSITILVITFLDCARRKCGRSHNLLNGLRRNLKLHNIFGNQLMSDFLFYGNIFEVFGQSIETSHSELY